MGDESYAELRVQIPQDEGFISRLLKSFRKDTVEPEGGEPIQESPQEDNGILFTKSKSGNWLWFARYSNKYLDNDYPREIIAEESHLNFVKEVNEGRQDLPDLWLHHIEGTTWGKAMWVGYDNGFALAAGEVYPEHSGIAKSLAGKKGLLLSHGMDPNSIVRDEQNPNIILRHATKEISVLPASRAANKLTGFVILEEDNNMKEKGISEEDRATLLDMGIPENFINGLQESNKTLARIVDDAKLPSKDQSEETQVEETEASTEAEVEETEATEVVEEPKQEVNAVVDDEVITAIIDGIEALGKSVKSIAGRLEAIETNVQSLDQEQSKLVGESTKAARLGILKSVIGQDETRVDGRTSQAKDGPKETKSNSGGAFFFQEKGWTHGN